MIYSNRQLKSTTLYMRVEIVTMKHKYRIATVLLILVICIVTIFFYLLSYNKISAIYSGQTQQVILDLKKSFLKDTVNNLICEIGTKRETKIKYYKRIMDKRYKELNEKSNLNNDEFINFFINLFKSESNPNLWIVHIWDNKKNKVVYDSQGLYEDDFDITFNNLKEKLDSYCIINHGELTGVFGVSKKNIEENIKLEIIEKIRSFKFENNSYIWVNEIINYDGGTNYAIRRVHPNLPETEGMYLSTDLTDIRGKFPYLEELEGVKKSGELFFTYHFKKLKSDLISEKLTYAKLYKDYDWIIAMGVHIDDIQTYIDKTNNESRILVSELIIKLILVFVAILIFGFILLILLEKMNFLSSKKKLENEINQDSLTKASSRRCGTNDLMAAFKDYQINRLSPAIMILDIDTFKSINDLYGHDVGDQVLIEVVKALYRIIRSSDKLIRWGGDEFVGIFYGLQPNNLLKLGEKILSEITSLKISVDSKIISPTVSIGFSYFKESDIDFSNALKRADEALYQSKAEGKNRMNMVI